MRSFSVVAWAALVVGVLCASALAADALFTRAILHSGSVEAGRVLRLSEGVGDPNEIPIFGASKARANYIPEELGPRFYNYGFYSASPDVSNMLVAFALKRQSTAPIVIDLHQGAFQDIGDVRNYIPAARSEEVAALLRLTNHWRWYYAIPGIRYFGSYDWYLKGVLSDHIQVTHSIARGYTHEYNTIPWNRATFDDDVRRRLAEPFKFGLDVRQRARFLELIRSAPNRKFYIVLSPLHRSFMAHSYNEPAFRMSLNDFVRLPNVRVFDFTRTTYPDEYFLNTGHLNYRGAVVFSRKLRALIKHDMRH